MNSVSVKMDIIFYRQELVKRNNFLSTHFFMLQFSFLEKFFVKISGQGVPQISKVKNCTVKSLQNLRIPPDVENFLLGSLCAQQL